MCPSPTVAPVQVAPHPSVESTLRRRTRRTMWCHSAMCCAHSSARRRRPNSCARSRRSGRPRSSGRGSRQSASSARRSAQSGSASGPRGRRRSGRLRRSGRSGCTNRRSLRPDSVGRVSGLATAWHRVRRRARCANLNRRSGTASATRVLRTTTAESRDLTLATHGQRASRLRLRHLLHGRCRFTRALARPTRRRPRTCARACGSGLRQRPSPNVRPPSPCTAAAPRACT